MIVSTTEAQGLAGDALPVEIVERKGRGHPDSICDSLAERLTRDLSRFYRDTFGMILHHNVDKVLLVGGAAEPAFGGGRVTAPIEIIFAGRATQRYKGVTVPLENIAIEGGRAWLAENLHALDAETDVALRVAIRPGSSDLVDLFLRQQKDAAHLANDTSCGVGFAPLSALEQAVLAVERELTAPASRERHPATGEDVKVMGLRAEGGIQLTVAVAAVGRHLCDIDAYLGWKRETEARVRDATGPFLHGPLTIAVNLADDPAAGAVYLTVTGTSAEAGDDGEVGRGNRANGLITPYRPMTLEAAAGKNPVTHVGKLYNVVAGIIADAIVTDIPEIARVECRLTSQIGMRIAEPQMTALALATRPGVRFAAVAAEAQRIARYHLARIDTLAPALVAGEVAIDRFPLGLPRSEVTARHERARMVAEIASEARASAGYTGRAEFSPRVMRAMACVPRHMFVPPAEEDVAYVNAPLPIGHGQTISQPFVVAFMTELLELTEDAVVLEIGTGSGYQAAVLGALAGAVYSIEIVEPLAREAKARLERLGYDNVAVRVGDGYAGWPERAPFDAIIVTAGAPRIPPPLIAQLKRGGRLVIPVGDALTGQDLILLTKSLDGMIAERSILPVAFVPFARARE